jgi:serine/threonine-protein kinase
MSEVYEAIQIGTGRPIALKLLGGSRSEDARFVERLRREGYALGRIRHPNVVVVYDAGVADGQAWIAMDLLEGQSLRDLLLDQRRVPLPQALAYAGAIFDGLEAAHRLGIIHRDMKPENVFLTLDGGLKIVDFGNAKLLNSDLRSTDPHRVFGTAAYMSPEQLGFRRAVGPRSDLYAVGLMLYEMIAGRHPFSDGPGPYDLPPSIELCRMQIEEDPEPLAKVEPRVPAFVADLVTRLIAKDPSRRPDSAFLAAREARDLQDYVFREARSAGFTPGSVSVGPPRSPRAAVPTSSQPFSRSIEPQSRTQSVSTAVAVGAIAGTLLFAILSVSRHGHGPLRGAPAVRAEVSQEGGKGGKEGFLGLKVQPVVPASPAPPPAPSHSPEPNPPPAVVRHVTVRAAPAIAAPLASSSPPPRASSAPLAIAKPSASSKARDLDPYAPIF